MSNNLVSIIVPAYNAGLYILENLQSISNQSMENWECIIVNDGSTDITKELVENYIRDDKRFTLINTVNAGVSSARNTGIKFSKGYYIFPLDSDNYIHSECLARCLAEFDRNEKVKLVYTEAYLIGEEEGLWNLPAFNYKTMLKYNMVDNSALFLKSDFERVGGYRTNMIYGLEDWDFLIALLYGVKEEQVVKIREPLFYYRVTKNSRRMTVANSGRQKEMLDLMVFNNFSIYQEYFPNIFSRIHEYDFDKTLLKKRSVRFLTNALIRFSSYKNKFGNNKN